MAFNRQNTMKVTYTIRDQQKAGYASFYIGELTGQLPNPNEDEFQDFIGEFGSSLANSTDCYVEGATVSFDFLNDAAISFGSAADIERKGVLSLRTEDNFTSIFTIPGAKYSMFDPNDGETIIRDPSNSQSFNTNPLATHLNSIKDKLVNGVTINLATHPVTDRREKDLIGLRDAYKQHRSNSRG